MNSGNKVEEARRSTAAAPRHESSAKFSYCMKRRREFAASCTGRAFRAVTGGAAETMVNEEIVKQTAD